MVPDFFAMKYYQLLKAFLQDSVYPSYMGLVWAYGQIFNVYKWGLTI